MSETEQLIQVYSAIHTTVDRIAASAELREKFKNLLPDGVKIANDDELIRKLLNLRKSGKLPKHFRGV